MEVENHQFRNSINTLPWWKVIALSMYLNGEKKKYNYDNLLSLYEIGAKSTQTQQLRTAMRSKNRQLQDGNEYFKCDKGVDKYDLDKWYLTPSGIRYVEDNLGEIIGFDLRTKAKL